MRVLNSGDQVLFSKEVFDFVPVLLEEVALT
jgi:hypothetical protein